MYVQCEKDGNEYLLLDVLVDYQKDKKAISLSDQQITCLQRPVMLENLLPAKGQFYLMGEAI